MKLCRDDLGNNHLIEGVTKVGGQGTRQLHGALLARPGTEEHGGPCPALQGNPKQHVNTKEEKGETTFSD